MTIRDAYQNLLIELNKVQAPSLLIDDFIYMFNKGVQQYVNRRYNLFEIKQQLTDDLRVLTKTEKIQAPELQVEEGGVFGTSWRCPLPNDYLHILNCVCEFIPKNGKCDSGQYIHQGANKLDTTQWSHVINNYYMKPSSKRPYYYIININDLTDNPSFKNDDDRKKITERGNEERYGNSTLPMMQIKCGNTTQLNAVYIDYLRAPKYLSIEQEQLDDIVDTTQVIEFPDYVIYEIINEIVNIVMENGSNPRIQTHPPVSQSIA